VKLSGGSCHDHPLQRNLVLLRLEVGADMSCSAKREAAATSREYSLLKWPPLQISA
jgi:hypothetical protein